MLSGHSARFIRHRWPTVVNWRIYFVLLVGGLGGAAIARISSFSFVFPGNDSFLDSFFEFASVSKKLKFVIRQWLLYFLCLLIWKRDSEHFELFSEGSLVKHSEMFIHFLECIGFAEDCKGDSVQCCLKLLKIHLFVVFGVFLENLNKLNWIELQWGWSLSKLSALYKIKVTAEYHKFTHGQDMIFVLNFVKCWAFSCSVGLLTIELKYCFEAALSCQLRLEEFTFFRDDFVAFRRYNVR